MKFVVSLLICALIAFSTAEESNIKIELFSGSSAHWIAVAVQNAQVDTVAVQVQDASEGAAWVSMQLGADWGYWAMSSPTKFVFPISFRLTAKTGQVITVTDAISSFDETAVNTGVQFSAPVSPRHKHHTTTKAPTKAPVTSAPTKAPATTKAQVTQAPIKGSAPTKAPVTSAPNPVGSTSGNAGMKLLVPLYTYPGASWTAVAAGAALVPTVAVINPNSGPGNGPDSTYNKYMDTMHAAGVEMIGYVHTSYGTRAIADVKADIDQYAAEFPLVVGIFIDECSQAASDLPYYTEVYNYIMALPGYKYDVINPGSVPAAGYMSASTQIVTFEDTSSKFAASANPSWANAGNKDHFVVIAYAATTTSSMQSVLTSAKSKGYYGWAYVTNGAAGGSTYNALATYYASQAAYVAASIN